MAKSTVFNTVCGHPADHSEERDGARLHRGVTGQSGDAEVENVKPPRSSRRGGRSPLRAHDWPRRSHVVSSHIHTTIFATVCLVSQIFLLLSIFHGVSRRYQEDIIPSSPEYHMHINRKVNLVNCVKGWRSLCSRYRGHPAQGVPGSLQREHFNWYPTHGLDSAYIKVPHGILWLV